MSFYKKTDVKKSYGISLCRFNVKTMQYEILFIKKRYTYAFAEFVLGHYNKNNEERLKCLFNGMNHDEKMTILSLDFGKLWYKIWLVDPECSYMKKLLPEEINRYNNCKKQFERCFCMDNGEYLRKLMVNTLNSESIWEIPKGRRNDNEKILDCATRELEEETNIFPSQYRILHDTELIKMKHKDILIYENTYFIGLYEGNEIPAQPFKINPILETEFWNKRRYNNQNVKISFKNEHQLSEVISIRWMSLTEIKFYSPLYVDTCKKIIKELKKAKTRTKI